MMKLKDLRAMAHDAGLKYSESVWSEADRLARAIMVTAIVRAKKEKSPKLEGKHFSSILVVEEDGSRKNLNKLLRKRRKP